MIAVWGRNVILNKEMEAKKQEPIQPLEEVLVGQISGAKASRRRRAEAAAEARGEWSARLTWGSPRLVTSVLSSQLGSWSVWEKQ